MPQNQSATLAFLARTAERRIDTHGAILFLSGDRVLKIKRAVSLGYLDFSTPALRRAACEAELRLNRRTAPDLYLGLHTITRDGDGDGDALALDGAGEVVDYAIAMRRFADDALLLQVAERGELTMACLRDLADGIAAFHGGAAVLADAAGAARMGAVIAGNARSFAALPDGALPSGDVALLLARSQAALGAVAGVLDARARRGAVRHCHGDLHLANICLWQGRPVMFDCLEFSEELATTDVLYDLAFLLMDLWVRGYRAEANLVLNRYCDMAGQEDGLIALPLFLSVRAAIRAHVGAMGAMRQADAAARDAGLAQARAYLAAALGFLDPVAVGLVAVGGLSGTGKSTLAGALAPRIGAAPGARWLRSDVIRKQIAGVPPEQRLPPASYTAQASAQVYAAMEQRAGAVLAAGWPVVVDAVFARSEERARIAAAGSPFVGLWLEAPRDALLARVSARRGDASDADAAVVERQCTYDTGHGGDWAQVDAGGAPGTVLDRATAIITAQAPFILQKR